MPGSTTELNLSTAVDSDDNADYLTINLANSLRTVDALFNNVTGHTHAGAHQGAPVAPPAGSITSGMIQDGTIVAADLANAAVTNAKLASDTARLNLLTNGGFEIWQRGAGPFTASSAYTADRWTIGLAGTDTLSVSRDTANADSAGGSIACAACAFTLGTGAGVTNLSQNVKPGDVTGIANRAVSFSVRVRTSVANAVRVGIHNGTAFTYSGYHTGGGAYETLSVTATLGNTAVQFAFYVFFSVSCTAYVDSAMLVVGSQAADYAPPHPADDLARCLRYYEKLISVAGFGPWPGMQAALASSTTAFSGMGYRYAVAKAITPTVTLSALSNFQVLNSGGGSITPTAFTPANSNPYGFSASGTVAAGLVAGNATAFGGATGSSDMTAEANP